MKYRIQDLLDLSGVTKEKEDRLKDEFISLHNFEYPTHRVQARKPDFPIFHDEITKLKNVFITNNNIKKEANHIVFNPLINSRNIGRVKYNFDIPLNIMIDIDLKHDKPFKQYQKDVNKSFKDAYNAAQWLVDQFKNDEHIYMCDTSISGQGVKAIITILSDEFIKTKKEGYRFNWSGALNGMRINKNNANSIDVQNANEHEKVLDHFQINNFYAVNQYLKEHYGLKFYPEKVYKDINYIDSASTTISTATASSLGKNLHINPDNKILYYEIPENYEVKQIKEKNSMKYKNSISHNDIGIENRKFVEYLDKVIRRAKNENDQELLEQIKEKFIEIFGHYSNPLSKPVMYSLKLSDKYTREWFYKNAFIPVQSITGSEWIKRCYDFEKFNNELERMPTENGATTTLQDFFKYIIKPIKTMNFDTNADFFQNKYDRIIEYDKYLAEKKDEIYKTIDNNWKVVMKAKAGAGKTTIIFDYIVEHLEKYFDKGVIVVVIPKNSLLIQLRHIISSKYPDVRIYENFGDNATYTVEEKGVILSSTPKLEYLQNKNISLLVVDEIHNLVKYGQKINSKLPQSQKVVLLSATPEPYLINEQNYYYLNLEKKNKEKQYAKLYYTDNINRKIIDMVDSNRKQLIFQNYIDKNKKLAQIIYEKTGIEFYHLNKREDDDNTQKVLENERLFESHYFATSYINDGINFLNKEWDDVIIVDNGITTVFDIYQLSERFRKVDNLSISIIRKSRKIWGKPFSLKNIDTGIDKIKEEKETIEKLIKNKNNSNYEYDDLVQLPSIIKQLKRNDYIVNPDGIKSIQFDQKFGLFYFFFDDIFEDSLDFYFNYKVYENLYETEDIELKNNKELLNVWVKNHQEVINYLNTITLFDDDIEDEVLENHVIESTTLDELFEGKTETDTTDINLSSEKAKYLFFNNKQFFKYKYYQHLLCKKYEMNIEATFGTDIQFNNKLKRQKKLLIGSSEYKKIDKPAQIERDKINWFVDVIKKNVNPIFDKKDNRYYKVEDIYHYIINNIMIYEKFIDINGKHFFNLEFTGNVDEEKTNKNRWDNLTKFFRDYFNNVYKKPIYCYNSGEKLNKIRGVVPYKTYKSSLINL
jgi:hypothetical protein